jgi:hypothetical protein
MGVQDRDGARGALELFVVVTEHPHGLPAAQTRVRSCVLPWCLGHVALGGVGVAYGLGVARLHEASRSAIG